jgi:hypothetical protein
VGDQHGIIVHRDRISVTLHESGHGVLQVRWVPHLDGVKLYPQRLRGVFHRPQHWRIRWIIPLLKDTHATQARKDLLENL